MIKYLFEASFLCCINYLKNLSKHTRNKYSEDSNNFSFLHHVTQFTTQQPSSQNYSQFIKINAFLSLIRLFPHTVRLICNFSNTTTQQSQNISLDCSS